MTNEEFDQETLKQSKALAHSLNFVFEGHVKLEDFLSEYEIINKLKPSINHIMTTFADQHPLMKVKLAYYLLHPHVKEKIKNENKT